MVRWDRVDRGKPARSIGENLMNDVVAEFHKKYYGDRFTELWGRTYYKGIPCQKCPLDLWVYHELLYTYKPEFVVELGVLSGGTTAFLCDMADNMHLNTKVITVDVLPVGLSVYPRMIPILGSSIDPEVFKTVKHLVSNKTVIVILDSLHNKPHVLSELETYHPLIKVGGYLIVEDTNLNGHPVRDDWGPGPYEAVEEFLPNHPEFVVDPECERFMLTFNPSGYLKRIK